MVKVHVTFTLDFFFLLVVNLKYLINMHLDLVMNPLAGILIVGRKWLTLCERKMVMLQYSIFLDSNLMQRIKHYEVRCKI